MRVQPSRTIFIFNETAPTEIYTLSLHDALPIFEKDLAKSVRLLQAASVAGNVDAEVEYAIALYNGTGTPQNQPAARSEEHTSELQSRRDLVCRLLLEKKKSNISGKALH